MSQWLTFISHAGFHEIISPDLISIFTEQELELLISGLPEIDVDDWKVNTEYHNYSASSPQIQWFWRAVRSFDKEERAKLLQFVTGTSKVPLNGFKELEGMNGINRFNIHRDYGDKDRLPSSHTCFNRKFDPLSLLQQNPGANYMIQRWIYQNTRAMRLSGNGSTPRYRPVANTSGLHKIMTSFSFVLLSFLLLLLTRRVMGFHAFVVMLQHMAAFSYISIKPVCMYLRLMGISGEDDGYGVKKGKLSSGNWLKCRLTGVPRRAVRH